MMFHSAYLADETTEMQEASNTTDAPQSRQRPGHFNAQYFAALEYSLT
jgi:hypothetical protein